ncbi:myosin-2 essential light chain [Drosophila rhopaloa]|uniref:Myosin-2 essential light chain n=1 Tax=Drosophila rhopaloa TaxID=1041015 RepID=A0A6P4EDY4_DRORH|nr:myosin-2 essential light chain [Drosophila rhopaloa]
MSKAGNQPNSSSIHSSSSKAGFNQKRIGDMTAPTPRPKPEKRRILELHAIFLSHDSRGDNKISIRHLGDCLRVMGANPSEAMVNRHVRQLKAATLERISFDEVMTIYCSLGKHGGRSSPRKRQIEEEQFTSCLNLFDTDNSGFLSAVSILRILTQSGECMSKLEVDELLRGRINEQGMVNYKQLVHDIING